MGKPALLISFAAKGSTTVPLPSSSGLTQLLSCCRFAQCANPVFLVRDGSGGTFLRQPSVGKSGWAALSFASFPLHVCSWGRSACSAVLLLTKGTFLPHCDFRAPHLCPDLLFRVVGVSKSNGGHLTYYPVSLVQFWMASQLSVWMIPAKEGLFFMCLGVFPGKNKQTNKQTLIS